MSTKKKGWKPKAKPAGVVMPGRREPGGDWGIPELIGPTELLNFRIDQRTSDLIQQHFERLQRRNGVVPSVSETARSLIHRGAAAFEADDE